MDKNKQNAETAQDNFGNHVSPSKAEPTEDQYEDAEPYCPTLQDDSDDEEETKYYKHDDFQSADESEPSDKELFVDEHGIPKRPNNRPKSQKQPVSECFSEEA